ncbi:hypothetical protein V8E36_002363 [Tilletia maclaganii]
MPLTDFSVSVSGFDETSSIALGVLEDLPAPLTAALALRNRSTDPASMRTYRLRRRSGTRPATVQLRVGDLAAEGSQAQTLLTHLQRRLGSASKYARRRTDPSTPASRTVDILINGNRTALRRASHPVNYVAVESAATTQLNRRPPKLQPHLKCHRALRYIARRARDVSSDDLVISLPGRPSRLVKLSADGPLLSFTIIIHASNAGSMDAAVGAGEVEAVLHFIVRSKSTKDPIDRRSVSLRAMSSACKKHRSSISSRFSATVSKLQSTWARSTRQGNQRPKSALSATPAWHQRASTASPSGRSETSFLDMDEADSAVLSLFRHGSLRSRLHSALSHGRPSMQHENDVDNEDHTELRALASANRERPRDDGAHQDNPSPNARNSRQSDTPSLRVSSAIEELEDSSCDWPLTRGISCRRPSPCAGVTSPSQSHPRRSHSFHRAHY